MLHLSKRQIFVHVFGKHFNVRTLFVHNLFIVTFLTVAKYIQDTEIVTVEHVIPF